RTRGTPADQDPHAAACRGAAWNGGSARRPAPQPAASSPQEGPPPPRWRRPPPRRARGPSLRPSEARSPARAPRFSGPRARAPREPGPSRAPLPACAGREICLSRRKRRRGARENNPTKHGRELLGGHMPHANPTPTPQDF
ncbi:unnamed protein product, partial [Prorocentrum cordatum]